MKIILTTLLLFFVSTTSLFSQEIRAKVNIDAQQIPNIEKSVFIKMKTDVEEFLNLRKWTNDVFSEEEKINCSVNITLESQPSQGKYKGSIYVLSSRPIYNSVYNSTLYKVLDNEFIVNYDDFSVIEFNENTFQSNFGSILAYYAYMMIGFDYDSFSEKSGEKYFEKAIDIVRSAQGEEEYKKGWRSSENNENRYWMVENILNQKYEKVRLFSKVFHLDILDDLYSKNPALKTDLHAQILELEDLKFFSNSFLLRTFFEIKAEEIYNISKELDQAKQKDVKRIMTILNPTNKKYWNKLGSNKKSGTASDKNLFNNSNSQITPIKSSSKNFNSGFSPKTIKSN